MRTRAGAQTQSAHPVKKTPIYLWAAELVAQFIEGASDAFLIVFGGVAIAQNTAATLPPITFHQLVITVALGGALYAASYLKKNPLPPLLRPPAAPSPTP